MALGLALCRENGVQRDCLLRSGYHALHRLGRVGASCLGILLKYSSLLYDKSLRNI